MVGQVGQQLAGVQIRDDRALGHRDLQVLAALSVLILALAVHAVLRAPVWMITEGQQRGDVAISNQPDVATLAAVATIGAPERFGSFATERRAAGATIAAAYIQLRFIDEPAHRTS